MVKVPNFINWRHKKNLALWIAASLAGLYVIASLAFEGRFGLNIGDEGFLWYGVQRVLLGEIPIRDFMAYDPGRYYWAAGLMSLWGGRGILDLRVAVAVFQWLGLACGLWVLVSRGGRRQIGALIVAGLVMLVWMFPRHKLFDIALSLILVALFTWWLHRPNARRHFIVGIVIGIVACFGRNHGVYALIGSVLVFAWLTFEQGLSSWRALLAWAMGIAVGFLPIGIACLLAPGFAQAFWASVIFLFELKATNLPLPIPWPWRVPYTALPTEDAIRGLLIGLAFMGLIIYPLLGLVKMFRQRAKCAPIDAPLVATVCLAIPYAHYAFSRADIGHLAQGIFPALLGTFLLLGTMRSAVRWVSAAGILLASIWATALSHPALECWRGGQCQDVVVSGQRLMLEPSVASDVSLLRNLAIRYAPIGRAFVTTPLWPGAYALLERRSPLWEIYALTPRSQVFQQSEIERLRAAKPAFIVVYDVALDNREELRYRNTHPLIEKYVEEHFIRLKSANPAYHLYRAPDAIEASN
jgi:hypothetical protein